LKGIFSGGGPFDELGFGGGSMSAIYFSRELKGHIKTA
jgi:hypothetical protein